jgi:sulfate permease, SulP family
MNLKERFFSNVRGDVFGGVTAAIVALPLALGFGVASGLENGAAAGMYGAIAIGIFAAIFGGTPTQISGPTGPMTVVVAGIATALTGDPRWIFVMVALAGAFQILMCLLRIGRYVNYVPYPVVSGFMTGIGVIVVVLQLGALLGHSPASSPVQALLSAPEYLSDVNLLALGLGLTTIAIIYTFPLVSSAVPGTLVALVVVTALSVALPGDVPRIGAIPSGLPTIQLPELDWDVFLTIIPPALVLGGVGAIDSLLTSLVADKVTKTQHDSDRELMGQGIGNIVAGLIGGLPGAGATMRTVVNVQSGGRSHLSGVVHGLLLLSFLLVLGPLAARIPMAVLAGILFTVGIGIMDRKGLRHLFAAPRGDSAAMVAVLALTVFVDLMWAVAIGMVISSLLLVKRLADVDPARHGPLEDYADTRADLLPLDLPKEALSSVHLVEMRPALFFGNAGPLQRRLAPLKNAEAVVLEMHQVTYIDQSGAYAFAEVIAELRQSDTRVYISGLQAEPGEVLTQLGFMPEMIPLDRVFADTVAAVQRASEECTSAAPGSATDRVSS